MEEFVLLMYSKYTYTLWELLQPGAFKIPVHLDMVSSTTNATERLVHVHSLSR